MDKSTASAPALPAASFLSLIEETLKFELQSTAVSALKPPHVMGWRTLPCAVFVYMDAGTMLLELDGGKKIEISSGGGYVVSPGVHQRNSLISRGGECRWAHVNYTIFEGVSLFSLINTPIEIPPPLARACADVVSQLIQIKRAKEPSLLNIVKRQVAGLTLLAYLAEISTLQQNALEFVQFSQRVAPALAHIHRNIRTPISVEALARQAHLSTSRFHDVFRNAIGVAPRDYIQRLRLQTAQQLLIGTDLAIREIATRVGQNDPFYFSRNFRKYAGMSPRQYRRHVRKSVV